ncbi:hypothetical protein HDU93_005438 [Gonapodya sp. JEL0774]|nr:hypothetical protein HDU93_005438 [Gonapodya sp. JEL0774]
METGSHPPPGNENFPPISRSESLTTLVNGEGSLSIVPRKRVSPIEDTSNGLPDEGTIESEASEGPDDDDFLQDPTEGSCSFWQTVFNTYNILVGIGVLTLPYAIHLSGWVIGIGTIIGTSALMDLTGKLIINSMNKDPTIHSIPDLADSAFGLTGELLATVVFAGELIAVLVGSVVLVGDNMLVLLATFGVGSEGKDGPGSLHGGDGPVPFWTVCVLCGVTCYLLSFLPLRYLAYTSAAGMGASLLLVAAIFWDGFATRSPPGSLLDPMPTRLFPDSLAGATLIVGIACASVPTLYLSMKEKYLMPLVLDLSFFLATLTYLAIGCTGYLMFGELVEDEVTKNLAQLEANKWLGALLAALMVFIPLTKFPLCVEPTIEAIESAIGKHWIGIEGPPRKRARSISHVGRPVVRTQRTLAPQVIAIRVATERDPLLQYQGLSHFSSDALSRSPPGRSNIPSGPGQEDLVFSGPARGTASSATAVDSSVLVPEMAPKVDEQPGDRHVRYGGRFLLTSRSRLGVRTALIVFAVTMAILFPKFESIMGIMGAAFSSIVCTVIPAGCAWKMGVWVDLGEAAVPEYKWPTGSDEISRFSDIRVDLIPPWGVPKKLTTMESFGAFLRRRWVGLRAPLLVLASMLVSALGLAGTLWH